MGASPAAAAAAPSAFEREMAAEANPRTPQHCCSS